MPNPLAWFWRKFGEFLNPTAHRPPHSSFEPAENNDPVDPGDADSVPSDDGSHHPEPAPPTAVVAEPDQLPTPEAPTSETPTQGAKISFAGADLPAVEPLERLLNDLWGYFKTQEALIADEQKALQTLQQRIETNQRWIQQYESRGYSLEHQTAYEFNLERHRSRCYRRELKIYQKIRELRQQKINSLESNRNRIAMLLGSLRSELLKIDSFCTSVDTRFEPADQQGLCSVQSIEEQIDAFRQSFDESRTQERQAIADFNSQLHQLSEA